MAEGKRVARRMHDAQLKTRVVALCAEPGASVAQVALDHGLNANLVHRWRRIAEGRETGSKIQVASQFVALPLQPELTQAPPEVVHIEVRRADVVIRVDWPVSSAAQCGRWLAELLQ